MLTKCEGLFKEPGSKFEEITACALQPHATDRFKIQVIMTGQEEFETKRKDTHGDT